MYNSKLTWEMVDSFILYAQTDQQMPKKKKRNENNKKTEEIFQPKKKNQLKSKRFCKTEFYIQEN